MLTGLAWAADAMEVLLLSFLGPSLRCDWGVTPEDESAIATVVFVGMAVGAYSWGAVSDIRGRKFVIIASSAWVFLAGIGSAVVPSYGWMLLMRFLVGVGIGGVPVSFTMFLELIPAGNRGMWSVVMQLWWTVGTVAQTLMAWGVLRQLGWRWLLVLSALPLLVLSVSFVVIPRSPRFLLSKGRLREAEESLQSFAKWNRTTLPGRLRGAATQQDHAAASELVAVPPSTADGSSSPLVTDAVEVRMAASDRTASPSSSPLTPRMTAKLPTSSPEHLDDGGSAQQQQQQQQQQRQRQERRPKCGGACARLKDVLTIMLTTYRRTTIIMWFLWVTAAFSYYVRCFFVLNLPKVRSSPPPAPRTAPHTLQGLVLLSTELHLQDEGGCGDNNEPPLRSKDFREICITASAEFPGMVMAGLLVDRLGRRKLQALDFGIVACALSVLLFFSGDISHTTRQVMLFVGRACMMGAFTVLFTYTAEVYSTNIRSTAFGVCNSFSRIGGMVAPFVGEGLIARGENQLAIGLFAGFCAAAAVLCLFLPIETAGRSLEGPSGAAPAATVVKDGFDGAGAGVGAGAGAGAGIVPADGDAAADHSGFGSDGTMSSGSDAHASRSVFGKKRPSYGTVDATVDGGVPSAI